VPLGAIPINDPIIQPLCQRANFANPISALDSIFGGFSTYAPTNVALTTELESRS
jgi:hypothetical protein